MRPWTDKDGNNRFCRACGTGYYSWFPLDVEGLTSPVTDRCYRYDCKARRPM